MHSYNQIDSYTYVDTQTEFNRLCEAYSKQRVIAIDTEFVRTQTLTPLLGLIQVFDGQQVALIDPVVINDLEPFAKVLRNPNIIKVAHACSEDLEALWHTLGVIPTPLYDTQFAAGLLDLGVSVGYANLVEQLFKIELDKGESRTDWMQRPLSRPQLAYAAADVTHLMAIYEHLVVQTDIKQQTDWIYQEVAQLGLKKSLPVSSEHAYLLLKNNWKLRGHQLAALQMLAKWRLETARKENKSVNFVVKEDALYELATVLPDNNQKLFECKFLYSKPARLYGETLINICRQAKKLGPNECPAKVNRLIEFSGYKGAMKSIKALVDEVATKHNVPVSLLASKKQINHVLKWLWFDIDEAESQGVQPDLISAWRRDLLQQGLQSLLPTLANHHEIKRSL